MIDLHNHILPGIDDGADSWDTSLAMAKTACADGISAIACTPHWIPGKYENSKADIAAKVDEFNKILNTQGIALKAYPGAELRLDRSIIEKIKSGELMTINGGPYALIELPDDSLPDNFEDFLWQMALQNIKPVISHVERHPYLYQHPERIFKWVEMGVLNQVTSASLLGKFSPELRDFAVMLLEHRLVHILVSDSHGLRVRMPILSEGYDFVRRTVGKETADKMVYDIPRDIIAGKEILTDDPVPFKKKKWFDFCSL